MPVYTYTTLDDPSATADTVASGINDAGDIVGNYDATSGRFTGGHGFLKVAARYSTLDDPVGIGHLAQGINDTGQIVGYYQERQRHSRLPLKRRQLHHRSTIPRPPPSTVRRRHQRRRPDRRLRTSDIYCRCSRLSVQQLAAATGSFDDPDVGRSPARHLCTGHQRRGPDRRVLRRHQRQGHGFLLERQHLHHPRRSLGHQRHLCKRHQQRGPDRRLLPDSQRHRTASSTAAASTPPSTIPRPRAAPMATGINDAGQIVGSYHDASGSHGFLATPRRTRRRPPAPPPTWSCAHGA